MSLFTDGMILYLESSKILHQNLLEQVSEFNKISG